MGPFLSCIASAIVATTLSTVLVLCGRTKKTDSVTAHSPTSLSSVPTKVIFRQPKTASDTPEAKDKRPKTVRSPAPKRQNGSTREPPAERGSSTPSTKTSRPKAEVDEETQRKAALYVKHYRERSQKKAKMPRERSTADEAREQHETTATEEPPPAPTEELFSPSLVALPEAGHPSVTGPSSTRTAPQSSHSVPQSARPMGANTCVTQEQSRTRTVKVSILENTQPTATQGLS